MHQNLYSRFSKLPQRVGRFHLLVGLAIAVLGSLAYMPTLIGLPFLADDYNIVKAAAGPDGGVRWGPVLADFYGPVMGSKAIYRPLYLLSFGVDFMLYGANAFGFHMTNFLLHLISSFFVYLVTLELISNERRREIAATAGILFVLHPLHPEAVTWVAGRVDVICAVFYVPAVYFFLRWLRTNGRVDIGASLIFFVLALMSKEMAATLPGIVFLVALYKGIKLKGAVFRTLPFAIVLGVFLLVRQYFLIGASPIAIAENERGVSDLLAGFSFQTLHSFLPLNLSVVPSTVERLLSQLFGFWPLTVALFLIAGACYLGRWRNPFPALLLVLYAVSLTPVIRELVLNSSLISSRWFYIPSVFLSIFVSYVAWTLLPNRRWQFVFSGTACIIFFAMLMANNSAWTGAGEIADTLVEAGVYSIEYPLRPQGAKVFLDEGQQIKASSPPFTVPAVEIKPPPEIPMDGLDGAITGDISRVDLDTNRFVIKPLGERGEAILLDSRDPEIKLYGEEVGLDAIEEGRVAKVGFIVNENERKVARYILLG